MSDLLEKHVLLVCPSGYQAGGAEQVFLSLAARLPTYGWRATLAVLRPGQFTAAARAAGLAVLEYPHPHRFRDPTRVIGAIRWLAEQARSQAVGLIHATHTAHFYASPAALMTRLPEIWHVHDYPHKPDWVDQVSRRLPCRRVIFTTGYVASGYPKLLRRPYAIIHPNAVSAPVTRIDTEGVRERLGLPAGPLMLTVARLQSHKGHADWLDALPAVLAKNPIAAAVIVGRASTPDQVAYQAMLVNRCQTLGITNRVHFLGFVNDADLDALYRESAVLVHPAHSEGYGLVLLEAMHRNLAVIATAAAGPAEIIRTESNGLLIPVKDPIALAAAVNRVLADEPLAEKLRAGGRATASASSPDAMTKATVAVYEDVVAASCGGRS